jgi:hypothetical protein
VPVPLSSDAPSNRIGQRHVSNNEQSRSRAQARQARPNFGGPNFFFLSSPQTPCQCLARAPPSSVEYASILHTSVCKRPFAVSYVRARSVLRLPSIEEFYALPFVHQWPVVMVSADTCLESTDEALRSHVSHPRNIRPEATRGPHDDDLEAVFARIAATPLYSVHRDATRLPSAIVIRRSSPKSNLPGCTPFRARELPPPADRTNERPVQYITCTQR